MRLAPIHIALMILGGLVLGYYFGQRNTNITIKKEGFQGGFALGAGAPVCNRCGRKWPCSGCGSSAMPVPPGMGSGGSGGLGLGGLGGSGGSGSFGGAGSGPAGTGAGSNFAPTCPPCREPDLSKYVLKSSVPPCPSCPDMSQYMLKTECPPAPDLSKYVLKSSIPKPQPIIIDNSACKKDCGECPPCPRPRCPDVKCPPATKCPPPAPCPRPVCPPQVVKCKAEEASYDNVRPYLAPLSLPGFGMS